MRQITKKEQEVLQMISEGLSSHQIAQALTISEHTVETHRKNLLIKLDAKNAAELIKKAIEANSIMLDIPDNQPKANTKSYESDAL